MIRTERFKGLEEKIGYTFTNKRTLALAMTHSSYANEQRGRRKANNERLEFLGDAVLEVTISDYVFREYPGYNEGRLTKLRSSLVCEYTLAICARDVELGKYLLLSRGEDATGGRERDSILSDAFEALIGARFRCECIKRAFKLQRLMSQTNIGYRFSSRLSLGGFCLN